MICSAWIFYLILAGTFGDLSFLINRHAETKMVKRGGGGGHHQCDHQCMVDEMLVNVGMAFDKEHCKAFEHVNCPDNVIPNEQLCSNANKTYPNHCLFVQDSCFLSSEHHKHTTFQTIAVKHEGPCVASTVQPATATTQHAALSNSLAAVDLTTQQAQSTTLKLVTQAPTSTTTLNLISQTTTPSVAQILGNMFCTHKDQFICDKTIDVVCGSDGTYYPNTCEFSKLQCDDYTLVQKDIMFCNTQTVG